MLQPVANIIGLFGTGREDGHEGLVVLGEHGVLDGIVGLVQIAGGAGVYSGYLHIQQDGECEFLLRDGYAVSIGLDGAEFFSEGEMRTRLQLRPGLHELEIWVQESALSGAALLWNKPGDEDFLVTSRQ